MDDHFEHSILIPLEPESAPRRRHPVVILAVVVITIGVICTVFWRQLFSLPSFFSSPEAIPITEQAPPTIEEKAALLQGTGGTQDSPSAPPAAAKAELLQSSGASAPSSQISAEEKAKLLQGQ